MNWGYCSKADPWPSFSIPGFCWHFFHDLVWPRFQTLRWVSAFSILFYMSILPTSCCFSCEPTSCCSYFGGSSQSPTVAVSSGKPPGVDHRNSEGRSGCCFPRSASTSTCAISRQFWWLKTHGSISETLGLENDIKWPSGTPCLNLEPHFSWFFFGPEISQLRFGFPSELCRSAVPRWPSAIRHRVSRHLPRPRLGERRSWYPPGRRPRKKTSTAWFLMVSWLLFRIMMVYKIQKWRRKLLVDCHAIGLN